MATSLAAQLKRLATPQTTLLIQDKKRASLLFDPREAANKDRETIFEIGLSGLEELKKLNRKFEIFEATLFNVASRDFERSVEVKGTNQKLDKNIRQFLLLLSPYFLIPASHNCLEWLINRFHIQLFNKVDILMLIFPYHETKIFVRCLQLLDLSSTADPWHWLEPRSQSEVYKAVPLEALYIIARTKWFIVALSQHALSGSPIIKLLVPLLSGMLKSIQSDPPESSEVLKKFADNVLAEITFTDADAATIIRKLSWWK